MSPANHIGEMESKPRRRSYISVSVEQRLSAVADRNEGLKTAARRSATPDPGVTRRQNGRPRCLAPAAKGKSPRLRQRPVDRATTAGPESPGRDCVRGLRTAIAKSKPTSRASAAIRFLPWILLVLSAVCPQTANASAGDGLGAGPVLGFSGGGRWSLGWEVSGTVLAPLLKASIGGTYALAPRSPDPTTIHYVAYEPWLFVGATVGAAVVDGPEFRLAYGVWEGLPLSLGGDLFDAIDGKVNADQAWLLTLTLGVRGFGSTAELYFTPKLWYFETYRFFN